MFIEKKDETDSPEFLQLQKKNSRQGGINSLTVRLERT